MKQLKLFVLVLFLSIGSSKADERSEWLVERRAWIEQAKRAKTPESMQNLARIVSGVGRSLDQASPEAKDLFNQAQSYLLSIPGHAEYYRDRINDEREKLEEVKTNGNVMEIADQRREWQKAKTGFQVMAHLPSVETVRVLSEFITDDRGKLTLPPKPTYDDQVAWQVNRPHSYSALFSLNALPLVSKPCKPLGHAFMPEEMDDAVKSWQQWFEEIKAGKRTFRFEGDPTDYDLNGPATKDKVERIAMHQRRENERNTKNGRMAEKAEMPAQPSVGWQPSKSVIYGMIAAGIAVVFVLIWFFKKAKRAQRI
jgi:hypothetical protein